MHAPSLHLCQGTAAQLCSPTSAGRVDGRLLELGLAVSVAGAGLLRGLLPVVLCPRLARP